MFMAPEIVDLNWETTEYTYSGDIWSIGVIFFCLFTSTVKEINLRSEKNRALIKKDISTFKYQFEQDYIQIIQNCLDKDPKKRLSSKEILKKLVSLQEKIIVVDIEESVDEIEIEKEIIDSKYAIVEEEHDLDKSFRF
jgi:serine/threonine protein kinase